MQSRRKCVKGPKNRQKWRENDVKMTLFQQVGRDMDVDVVARQRLFQSRGNHHGNAIHSIKHLRGINKLNQNQFREYHIVVNVINLINNQKWWFINELLWNLLFKLI